MTIFAPSSGNLMLSLKVFLISTAVFATAVMLKLSVPAVADFTLSELPSIWSFISSWLKPPYLYIVINFIIFIIVATSKLQSKFDQYSFSPPPLETALPVHPEPIKLALRTEYAVAYCGTDVFKPTVVMPQVEYGYAQKIYGDEVLKPEEIKVAPPSSSPEFEYGYASKVYGSDGLRSEMVEVPPPSYSPEFEYAYSSEAYGGEVLKGELVGVAPPSYSPEIQYGYAPKIVKAPGFDAWRNVDGRIAETKNVKYSEEMRVENRVSEGKKDATVNAAVADGDFVMSKSASTRNILDRELTEFSKPPVSARFGHRKVVKTTPEGGKTLRVSKPKRHDTLESTWKTITDGRPMPLTRHLRKSDTWETHGGHHHRGGDGDLQLQDHKMSKSETFNDRGRMKNPSLARSSGSGKLRKDPSLSQDELNKRVEAFINKFNEEMRLQRQESMNQFMEMINRGAH